MHFVLAGKTDVDSFREDMDVMSKSIWGESSLAVHRDPDSSEVTSVRGSPQLPPPDAEHEPSRPAGADAGPRAPNARPFDLTSAPPSAAREAYHAVRFSDAGPLFF